MGRLAQSEAAQRDAVDFLASMLADLLERKRLSLEAIADTIDALVTLDAHPTIIDRIEQIAERIAGKHA